MTTSSCVQPIGITWGLVRKPLLPLHELRVVQSGACFSSLSRELGHAVLSLALARRVRHGERVFSQGARADEWLCVVRGCVRLCHRAPTGRRVVANFIPPGAWIGDSELCDGEPWTHSAHAHGDTELLTISRADFHVLCQRYPELCTALLRLQCTRLRAMVEQVVDLHALSLEQRVAKQLLRMEDAFGVDVSRGRSIALRLSQSELAELVGASRQRTNGVLRQLERDGAVRLASFSVQIVAHEVLRARAAPT
jgi:CRP-like cAMP-binding protein